MYEYRATVIKVVDGDTLQLMVDLGCDVNIKMTVRLAGIDTPEMSTEAGRAARKFLIEAIADTMSTGVVAGASVIVRTMKDKKEKYGRYLAYVHPLQTPYEYTLSFNDQLIANGHARRYEMGT